MKYFIMAKIWKCLSV